MVDQRQPPNVLGANVNKARLTAAKYLMLSRKKAGLTQREVGNVLGFASAQFVSNWERGVARIPVHLIRQVSELYGTDWRKLVTLVAEDFKQEVKQIAGVGNARDRRVGPRLRRG